MTNDLYSRKPLAFIEGIPIFSVKDDYIRNYEHIAEDHIKSVIESGLNPFMQPQQIQESELQTSKVIREFVQPNSAILDAGIGLSEVITGLKDFECHGVDIAMPYLKMAKSHGLNVAMTKLEELPYNNQYFDAIIACDVLEHVFGLDLVIAQFSRVLKSSGFLIVRVPNEECLDSYLTKDQNYSHSHVRTFSLNSLRLYLEKCFGFQYVDYRNVGYFFNSFHQIKYQAPTIHSGIRSILLDLFKKQPKLVKNPAFSCINKLLVTSTEELVDSLIFIRDSHPDIYKIIAPELIKPMELIVIFRKP
ncbi:MAG: methyltransferase domain-containing protein [Acinetobacter sp.]|nr:methyltransferase domain-containing protein [Acinetobacter sp.]